MNQIDNIEALMISNNEIKTNKLYWCNNNFMGIKELNNKFNYSIIYSNKKIDKYSDNNIDEIPTKILQKFLKSNSKCCDVVGIYIYSSKKLCIQKRDIDKKIHKIIINNSCVICGSESNIICDYKNDLYNDERLLNTQTQQLSDFQPLCKHHNLQKIDVCNEEKKLQKIYSAKNITQFKMFPFEFPWEKKAFDKTDINCKKDTYFFDPVEFTNKIYCYSCFVIPIINAIKHNIKYNKVKLIK